MYEDQYAMWECYGKAYGYPSCCRLVFALRKQAPDRSKLSGTGYVPCACCERLPTTLLIQRVNLHRSKDEVTFPSASGMNFKTALEVWIKYDTLPTIDYLNYLNYLDYISVLGQTNVLTKEIKHERETIRFNCCV